MSRRPAAFLDRDGVLNDLVPDPRSGAEESPLQVSDVNLIPGAAVAAKRLAEAGFALVGVSNQPAAAKGTITLGELWEVQDRVIDLLGAEGVEFDEFRLCLHHPEAISADLRDCDCRKPAPGMLLEAAAALELDLNSSWMIGDTESDVGAGRAAGCRTVLIENPGSAHKRQPETRADLVVADLRAATASIVSRR